MLISPLLLPALTPNARCALAASCGALALAALTAVSLHEDFESQGCPGKRSRRFWKVALDWLLDGWRPVGHVLQFSGSERNPAQFEVLRVRCFDHGWIVARRRSSPGPRGGRDVFAFSRLCPHAGLDLSRGDIEDLCLPGVERADASGEAAAGGERRPKLREPPGQPRGAATFVMCPAHSYVFDARSGACVWDATLRQPPATAPLKTAHVCVSRVFPIPGVVWLKQATAQAAAASGEPAADLGNGGGPAAALPEMNQEAANEIQLEMVMRGLSRTYG
uniref:Rieske domain-containing protein n=1 Tax=Alexandrium monilatum TaxID=311494 RepID=A0A7S4T876_9DINO|mmetsp:Transcript_5798/g.18278  ORF Transcript_5798/g.18278 Transcript_5798/m.18278 type:complete len:277 (-) Transcript_5798:27-857(-)